MLYRAVVLCLYLSIFVPQYILAGAPGPVGPRGPTGPKGGGPPSSGGLPFCEVDPKIARIIKNLFTNKKARPVGSKGDKDSKRRHSRATKAATFPNCEHAGIHFQNGNLTFDTLTYECCNKPCQFPGFTTCVDKTRPPHQRCLDEANQCIENCIDKHIRQCDTRQGGQKGQAGQKGKGGQKGQGGQPGSPAERCPTRRKKVGSSYCIERTCIPIDL